MVTSDLVDCWCPGCICVSKQLIVYRGISRVSPSVLSVSRLYRHSELKLDFPQIYSTSGCKTLVLMDAFCPMMNESLEHLRLCEKSISPLKDFFYFCFFRLT
ncbi:hypothetical protein GOODEAATRI_024220 [Goodea atripinnis]|uniref:Uncharacterized protein n=1 Tax=Goodea atripinnis TaxID=208336 RepID=A0ABV0PR82_9TELE